MTYTGNTALAVAVVGRRPTGRAWLVPFLIAGGGCVIAGGLLAAATAYVSTEKSAWATAYLVLVGGVAQIALGAAVAWLTPAARQRWAWPALIGWNLGNAGVLAGQLGGLVALTDAGGALLVIALALVVAGTLRRQQAPVRDDVPALPSAHPALLVAFRALVVLLALSIPVGLVLANLGR